MNKAKVKRQRKLNMHIIFESGLTLFSQNYQNQSVVDVTKLQLAKVDSFLRHSVCVLYPGQTKMLACLLAITHNRSLQYSHHTVFFSLYILEFFF